MNPFAPIQPFITHPERIAAVAAVLAVAAAVSFYVRRRVAIATTIAAAMWALFAVWEWYCKVQRHDIRVDLFLISPVLLVFTIGGVVGLFLPAPQGKRQFSLRALLIAMTLVALALGLISLLI